MAVYDTFMGNYLASCPRRRSEASTPIQHPRCAHATKDDQCSRRYLFHVCPYNAKRPVRPRGRRFQASPHQKAVSKRPVRMSPPNKVRTCRDGDSSHLYSEVVGVHITSHFSAQSGEVKRSTPLRNIFRFHLHRSYRFSLRNIFIFHRHRFFRFSRHRFA